MKKEYDFDWIWTRSIKWKMNFQGRHTSPIKIVGPIQLNVAIQLQITGPKEYNNTRFLKNQVILKIKIWLSSMYSNQTKGNLRESNTSFNAIMHIFHERFNETIFMFSQQFAQFRHDFCSRTINLYGILWSLS